MYFPGATGAIIKGTPPTAASLLIERRKRKPLILLGLLTLQYSGRFKGLVVTGGGRMWVRFRQPTVKYRFSFFIFFFPTSSASYYRASTRGCSFSIPPVLSHFPLTLSQANDCKGLCQLPCRLCQDGTARRSQRWLVICYWLKEILIV